jgi:hypothetical protein
LIDSTALRFGLAAAIALACAPALAQVYSWKDPANGQSKFSNIAPPWYNRGESVSGPRVIATLGDRVIDDTALAYEQRLLLLGRSKEYADRLRPQKPHGPADAMATRAAARVASGANNGS